MPRKPGLAPVPKTQDDILAYLDSSFKRLVDALPIQPGEVGLSNLTAALQAFLVPTGAMQLWGTVTAPTGWVLCDGTSYLRTAPYDALFAVIGTTFGNVDGTHFNVPDLRQRFPLGKAASGTGNTLAAVGGGIDHLHTGPSHHHSGPSHSHSGPSHNHSSPTGQASASGAGGTAYNNTGTPAGTVHNHSITADGTGATGLEGTENTSDDGTGNTGTTNPPFLVVNFIIKL